MISSSIFGHFESFCDHKCFIKLNSPKFPVMVRRREKIAKIFQPLRCLANNFFLYTIKHCTNILLITIATNYVKILQRRCHRERNTMSTLRPF